MAAVRQGLRSARPCPPWRARVACRIGGSPKRVCSFSIAKQPVRRPLFYFILLAHGSHILPGGSSDGIAYGLSMQAQVPGGCRRRRMFATPRAYGITNRGTSPHSPTRLTAHIGSKSKSSCSACTGSSRDLSIDARAATLLSPPHSLPSPGRLREGRSHQS